MPINSNGKNDEKKEARLRLLFRYFCRFLKVR